MQVPGLQDPTRLKEIIGKTAKLDFRMLDLSETPEQAQRPCAGRTSEILDGEKGGEISRSRSAFSSPAAILIDAQPGFDQRNGEPIVSFRFNSTGARKFAEATQQNVGKPFAIILDSKVISAPVIREPILGGTGQISGNFTVEQANDLAILLRAGALPAPLTVVEERTVGPGLGQDSINAGEHAARRQPRARPRRAEAREGRVRICDSDRRVAEAPRPPSLVLNSPGRRPDLPNAAGRARRSCRRSRRSRPRRPETRSAAADLARPVGYLGVIEGCAVFEGDGHESGRRAPGSAARKVR